MFHDTNAISSHIRPRRSDPTTSRKVVGTLASYGKMGVVMLVVVLVVGCGVWMRRSSTSYDEESSGAVHRVEDEVAQVDATPEELLARPEKQKVFQEWQSTHGRESFAELMELPSTFQPHKADRGETADVTAILNIHVDLDRQQLDSLLMQVPLPPAHIWLCGFVGAHQEAEIQRSFREFQEKAAERGITLQLFSSTQNLKSYGRYQIALQAPTRFVWILDDGVLPGVQYLKQLLHVAHTRIYGGCALLGSAGWLLPRDQDGVIPDYSDLHVGGLSFPDPKYGLVVERTIEVDHLCGMWFLEQQWLRLLFREMPVAWDTGEDMMLSYALRKYGQIRSYVLPVDSHDTETWGHTNLAARSRIQVEKTVVAARNSLSWDLFSRGNELQWTVESLRSKPSVAFLVATERNAQALRPIREQLIQTHPSLRLLTFVTSTQKEYDPIRLTEALGVTFPSLSERRMGVFDLVKGGQVVGVTTDGDRGWSVLADLGSNLEQVLRTTSPCALILSDDESDISSNTVAVLTSRLVGVRVALIPSPRDAHKKSEEAVEAIWNAIRSLAAQAGSVEELLHVLTECTLQ